MVLTTSSDQDKFFQHGFRLKLKATQECNTAFCLHISKTRKSKVLVIENFQREWSPRALTSSKEWSESKARNSHGLKNLKNRGDSRG
ncbi:hypothetical protein J6590_006605 [Homalodisca vitripennis]|nr:hypothetical protein J6590_006605 [Homalodisca vitripennis]